MLKYIYVVLLPLVLVATAHAARPELTIPTKAPALLPVLKEEIDSLNSGIEAGHMAAEIEAESCITLTHSRCWSPTSELLTYWNKSKGIRRENGVGLGQFTRAWYKDGSLRFDTLSRLTTKYRTRLAGLNWDTAKQDSRLQIRAMILLLLEEYNALPNTMDNHNRQTMASSAYNTGGGRLASDRRTCRLKSKCDPMIWKGNVELIKAPGFSTRILYGKRTAWQINRDYINKIDRNTDKYVRWFIENSNW